MHAEHTRGTVVTSQRRLQHAQHVKLQASLSARIQETAAWELDVTRVPWRTPALYAGAAWDPDSGKWSQAESGWCGWVSLTTRTAALDLVSGPCSQPAHFPSLTRRPPCLSFFLVPFAHSPTESLTHRLGSASLTHSPTRAR